MAKKMKIKLPKRVAGVKIPKGIRKGPVGHFLNSGAGQVILAETLVGAAAMFTAAKTDGVRRLGSAITENGADQTERLARACKAAGQAFREALQNEDADSLDESPDMRSTKVKTKKKSSARASSTTTH